MTVHNDAQLLHANFTHTYERKTEVLSIDVKHLLSLPCLAAPSQNLRCLAKPILAFAGRAQMSLVDTYRFDSETTEIS